MTDGTKSMLCSGTIAHSRKIRILATSNICNALAVASLRIEQSESVRMLQLHNLDDDTDVTVAVSSSDTGEATVSSSKPHVTEANWEVTQLKL